MAKNTRVFLLVSLLFSGLAGCATATVVEVEPERGGVIAVNPPQDPEARQKAKALMSQNCGRRKAQIVKEGQVVVGSTTEGNSEESPESQKSYNLFSGKSSTKQTTRTTSSSTTRNVTEWRIVYRCK